VPENVRAALGFGTAAANVAAPQNAGEVDAIQPAASAPPAAPAPVSPDAARPRLALDEALRGYFEFFRTDTAVVEQYYAAYLHPSAGTAA